MSNNSTNISVPVKGMNTDVHPANLTEQGYDFAQNAVVEEFSGNGFPLLQNEASTLPCANFPDGYQVIGFVNVIEQDRKILFLTNPTTGFGQIGEIIGRTDCDEKITDNDTELGECDSCGGAHSPEANPLELQNITGCCEYLPIATQTCFNFNINNPVKAVYRLEECGISVYFTDNRNPYRFIEFDYTNENASQPLKIRDKFKVVTGFDPTCNAPVYSNQVDCNKLLIDPVLEIPCLELVDVISGGDLKAGVYQFLLAYAEKNGDKRTPYFHATNPIPVFTRDLTFETDYRTDKAIQIKVQNISATSPFEYYNIAVAKTINGVTSFEFLDTFPIANKTFTYTGSEKSLKDLTVNDIFEQKVYYGTAKIIGTSNNYLFWAGLEETKKLNVQRIANKVKLYWQTIAVPEPVYRQPRFTTKFKSYLRDEVYALGLVLLFENGEESAVGHIPGRPATADDLTIVANDDVIIDPSCANISRNKKWQNYNTASVLYTNPSVPITDNCDDNKCYQYGEFAYFESTEKYPNNPEIWGELCNKPIRHHKFPDSSVTHIHDGLNATKTFFDGNLVFPIGIRVDHDSVVNAINQCVTDGIITEEDRNRIKGYRIVRGNRFGNKSIIAKGLLYDVWNYTKEGQQYFYPNYPFNSLQDDIFLTEDKSTYDDHDSPSNTLLPFRKTGRYTFHSPDTHFNSPELGEEIKLETEEYGKSEGYFNEALDQSKFKLLSTGAYSLALAGGIVAMLTMTEPEEKVEYTVKADVKITQADSTMDGSANGSAPYGNVTGSAPGSIFTTPASSAWSGTSSATVHHGDATEDHSTGTTGAWWDRDSGVDVGTVAGLGEDWTEKKVTTVKGTAHQHFNGITGGLYSAFLTAQNTFYKISLALNETEIILNLIRTMTPKVNYGIQYNAVGKYNAYKTVDNAGFKRRKIETYSYLKPEMSLINEAVSSLASGSTNIYFNNWHRETSVYLKTEEAKSKFNNPTVTDNSRFNIDCRGDSSCNFKNFDKKRYYKDISAFYASIKRYVSDQYGTIGNIEYIDTGHCIFLKNGTYSDCQLSVFGGDTFISRFALKRKHSFFLQTRYGMNDEIDANYSVLGNVAYPRYFVDTNTGAAQEMAAGGGIIDLITDPATSLGRPKSYLDSKMNKFFYQNGRMYLYSYGIPYFLVESDINCDFRYAENNKEKDFYPHVQDLDFWLQEKNVDPRLDNYYFYNNTYSKQNKEHPYFQYASTFEPGRMCRVAHPNRIIYSNGGNWLSYKANDLFDFPLANGRITGVDGIENDKVLVRSENTTQLFNAYVTISTNTQNIQVGTGGMFASKPQEYAHTTLGYAGSQHGNILHTEYGHIWVDAKRGQVFNLQGGQLDEISKDGMKNWFKENLPFELPKHFPTLTPEDIDNSFKGVGLVLGFDKRFNRFVLTKLDYKPIVSGITYDGNQKQFLKDGEVVKLTDNRYFCSKNWTVSYNFYMKSWVSFHSYTPNYYIDSVDYFASGLNGATSSLWLHNTTNKSYQVFYGRVHPFTVQTITKADINKNTINSIEFGLDAIRYHNDYDPFFTNDVTFNKAVVFNQNQNSGMLLLDYKTKRDLGDLMTYPITNVDSTTIRISNADGLWRFNQFYDIAQSRGNNIPLWLNNCANSEKKLNNLALDYQVADLDKKRIRGEYCKVKLTNDIHTNYKLLFKWLTNKTVKNYR